MAKLDNKKFMVCCANGAGSSRSILNVKGNQCNV